MSNRIHLCDMDNLYTGNLGTLSSHLYGKGTVELSQDGNGMTVKDTDLQEALDNLGIDFIVTRMYYDRDNFRYITIKVDDNNYTDWCDLKKEIRKIESRDED